MTSGEHDATEQEKTLTMNDLSERLTLEWVAELLEKYPKEKVLELVEKRIERIWDNADDAVGYAMKRT